MLAHQLGRTDAATWEHVRKAGGLPGRLHADGNAAPWTPQERWENQSGYSPATIAAEIAGLVCAASIARANGDPDDAARYLATADDWQARVKSWTVTTTGPYSSRPYFLRLTKDGNPDAGTTYNIGDSGPAERGPAHGSSTRASSTWCASACCRPATRTCVNTLTVVDEQLGVSTPNGFFWHRASFDGYGEKARRQRLGLRPAGRLADHPRPGLAAAQRRARRVPDRRRPAACGPWPAGHDGPRDRPRRHAARAGLGPRAAGRASRPARRRSRPRRWPGRTRSICGWPGTCRRAGSSSSRPWSPTATTPARDAAESARAGSAALRCGRGDRACGPARPAAPGW